MIIPWLRHNGKGVLVQQGGVYKGDFPPTPVPLDGTMAAVEAFVDTMTASGSPTLFGTMTALEMSVDVFTATGGGAVSGLTHLARATYIDASGTFQSVSFSPTSNPGITIPQYAHLKLDATASLSSETDADTELEAFCYLGHSWDSGEGLSGNWQYGGTGKNLADHDPINAHVYTTSGTFTLYHWLRDSAGRQSIATLTVTVLPRSGGTLLGTGGAWPTWASNTVYRLSAGANYTAKGAINLSGLHNVVILKDGVGADPIVGTVNWHTTFVSNVPQTRTRGCVLVGIDANNVQESLVGSMYCGSVFGRVRQYNSAPTQWYWENQSTTQTEKDNITRSRGNYFWGAGVMNSNGTNYVFICEILDLTIVDTDLTKSSGDSGQHVFRGWYRRLTLRNNRFSSNTTISLMSYNKIHGADNGSTFDDWEAISDRMGVWNGALYRPVCGKNVVADNVYGYAGQNNNVGTNIEVMPENNDTGVPAQAIEMVSVHGNVWYVTSWVGMNNSFDGRYLRYFNNKLNMGAGGETPYSTSSRTNRIPAGWNGPYVNAAPPSVVK